ncbi:hypothetical protein TRIUR3_08824 [Triticum urartu]|uniref:Uncharacterized protein n=1 Tax=Triticum urartu TaxID=4572 RepID=M8A528_TRIUA|nr:hypothetical protein TRIUR3_08824 [Triticum urartu]
MVVDPRKGKELAAIPSPPSSTGSSSSSTPSHDYAGGGADGSSFAVAWVDGKGRLSAVPFLAPFSPNLRGQHPRLRLPLRLGSSSTAGRRMMELEFHHILRQQRAVIMEDGEEEQLLECVLERFLVSSQAGGTVVRQGRAPEKGKGEDVLIAVTGYKGCFPSRISTKPGSYGSVRGPTLVQSQVLGISQRKRRQISVNATPVDNALKLPSVTGGAVHIVRVQENLLKLRSQQMRLCADVCNVPGNPFTFCRCLFEQFIRINHKIICLRFHFPFIQMSDIGSGLRHLIGMLARHSTPLQPPRGHGPPAPPATVHHCSSSETLELMAAFTAMCLVPYLNYLYARWSGRDGVLRMGSGTVGGLTRKRTGGGGIDKVALAVMLVFIFKAGAGDGSKM